ncbi:helix-turn-helix domain-containing protein [Mesorhizobium sp. M1380]|uniref:helix-turn-helix domain-containing protein n=1 Tax=Mesorhizobium sp. M1380 TaxID=2957093 RepID=UPI003339BF2F
MTSSHFELDPKEEAAAAFVSETGRDLQQALVDRKKIRRLTQQEIADTLGVDRSRVNRCFSGFANLSLASLAELCWAMDVKPHILFEQLLDAGSGNHMPVPASVGRHFEAGPPITVEARTNANASFTRAPTTFTNTPTVTISR